MPYDAWQVDRARVGADVVRFATKPGLVGHGLDDEASLMLGRAIAGLGSLDGAHVLLLQCGRGPSGAAAAMAGAHVTLCDRNVLAYEAAGRTLEANAAHGDTYLSHGCSVVPGNACEPGRYALVVIRIAPERVPTLQLVADACVALAIGGQFLIAGAVHEGIKPIVEHVQALFGNAMLLEQRSGHRIVRAIKRDAVSLDTHDAFRGLPTSSDFGRYPVRVREASFDAFTRPGVFSWTHLDQATALLAHAMSVRKGERVLDLGCGAGVLGTCAALLGRSEVCMVDSDIEAVRSADLTARTAGVMARALPSDVTSAVRGETFDVVVSNPPFHVGKATNLDLPKEFMRQSHALLAPGGSLQIVANSALAYEPMLVSLFGNVERVAEADGFKVLMSRR